MRSFTALFLTFFGLLQPFCRAQDTVLDWSKKVIELQEIQGQNFEQDLLLVKGLLYLQRRSEALELIQKINRIHQRKDPRLTDLLETASNQYFQQETMELYAEASILIRDDNWPEAKDRLETALKKEPLHRELLTASIQVALVTGSVDRAAELEKAGSPFYGDSMVWKTYRAWIQIQQKNGKEAMKILAPLWNSARAQFGRHEIWMLAFLRAMELNKYQLDWESAIKIIRSHPEWACSRLVKIRLKPLSTLKQRKELLEIKAVLDDSKKFQSAVARQEKEFRNQYKGLIPVESCKKETEELLSKISETK